MAANTINREVLRLAGPSILANITVPLVGMADLAVAGHIGDAASIGGIAIGGMLFSLLYWNMGFLRAGTSGVTAQAYGRGDFRSAISAFGQGVACALLIAACIMLIQVPFERLALSVLNCSDEVAALARRYFYIRVWAAPATLSLMVFKGWFLGMQNTVLPMVLDIVVNVVNVVLSILFAIPMHMGIAGVALGTVCAQYTGLLLAIILFAVKFHGLFGLFNLRESLKWHYLKGFFKLNTDLFVRSSMILVVYCGVTVIATGYGDVQLAVSEVMMNLLLLYSYFLDGFAYAGQALCGRYIGAGDGLSLRRAVKALFMWCLVIGVASTFGYLIFSQPLLRLFTDNAEVIAASQPYLFWLLLMPMVSCVAFTWDGIYIGATASVALRNSMIISAASFIITYFAFKGIMAIQAMYLAYFIHLVVRGAYQTIFARRDVFSAC